MIQIRMEMKGEIDIDSFEVDAVYPRCRYFNPVWIKKAR